MPVGLAFLHFLPSTIHFTAALLLSLALAGSMSKITLMTVTQATFNPIDGSVLAVASPDDPTSANMMFSILGACVRMVNGTEQCTAPNFSPNFVAPFEVFNLSAIAPAGIPPTLNATPGATLFTVITGWLSLALALIALSIVHLRQPQAPKLTFFHPRFQLGLLAGRRIFMAALAFCFISFFFGITLALAFDREFAQIVERFNFVAGDLPDSTPNYARKGKATTLMFVGISFMAISFFTTGYEYTTMPRKPSGPKSRFGEIAAEWPQK